MGKNKNFIKGVFAAFIENETLLHRFLRRTAPYSLDVEDIMQETVLRALEAEKAREISEPKAYLFAIAKNIIRDALDKKSRSIIDFIEDFAPQTDFPDKRVIEDEIDSRQRMLLFWEAVATLPAQCQRVFVLKKVYGFSHQEISRELGISISTTEKHAAMGLKRCSEFMEKRLQGGVSSNSMPDAAKAAVGRRKGLKIYGDE